MSDLSTQLSEIIDTSNFKKVEAEVRKIFAYHYPHRSFAPVRKCFSLIRDLFKGKFPGYKACNTQYHNLTHTMDAVLASIRLLDGYNITRKPLEMSVAINLLIAALLHDTGYIQEESDEFGTGAKFTLNHVVRSIGFLMKRGKDFGIAHWDVLVISRMIQCTGLSVSLNKIEFSSLQEKVAGSILGTADLLGQMADRVYLEKLLFLYHEFREAGIEGYNTAYDIIWKTVTFYETIKKKLNTDYKRVYQFSRYHFRDRFNIDRNLYIQAIEKNISYLKTLTKDDSTNFRKGLKRADWVDLL